VVTEYSGPERAAVSRYLSDVLDAYHQFAHQSKGSE
jgi:hypothetical protein